MTQTSYFWENHSPGDAGPYSSDDWSEFAKLILQNSVTTDGILMGHGSELDVSSLGGSSIEISSGAALIDGSVYVNDSEVDFSLSSPASGYNYYTLVLRKNFTAQTIRLVILGPNAASYPTVTQSAGTTWEVKLAEIRISSAGIVEVTDTRIYCKYHTEIDTDSIVDTSLDGAVIDTDAVEVANIKDANVTQAKLHASAFPYTAVGDIAYFDGSILQKLAATPDKVLAGNSAGSAIAYRAGMVLIEKQKLTSDEPEIKFSNIPQTFSNLCLVLVARHDKPSVDGGGFFLRVNGNDDPVYIYSYIRMTDNANPYDAVSGATAINIGTITAATADAGRAVFQIFHFINYSNNTRNKSFTMISGVSQDDAQISDDAHSCIYGGTIGTQDGITSIRFLFAAAYNFKENSMAALYGY